jgi:arsenate reductase
MPIYKKRVLFISTHNAARSQMMEGYLRTKYGDTYDALSAGTEPSRISPYAVTVMAEIGVDISGQRSKSLKGIKEDEMDLVVTVCPIFSWAKKIVRQNFPDPGLLGGSDEDILTGFRKLRSDIVKWIDEQFGS